MKVDVFEKALDDMENGVYDFTKDGKCSQCGECCSTYLPLSSKEIKEINRYLKKHHIKEQTHKVVVDLKPTLDLTCPFLNDNKEKEKCMIYPVRPGICKSFLCSTPPSKIEENKKLFWRTRKPYDMRKLFFGNEHKGATNEND